MILLSGAFRMNKKKQNDNQFEIIYRIYKFCTSKENGLLKLKMDIYQPIKLILRSSRLKAITYSLCSKKKYKKITCVIY